MSIVVTIPYDPLWKPLDWVKENCPSYITRDVWKEEDGTIDIYHNYRINYYFYDEKDAIVFKLKWQTT